MADTYTQLYIQLVFAVKHCCSFIQPQWKERLYQYITATVQNDKHKLLTINGIPDHIHIFIGLHPANAISDVVKDIKRASNNWINNNHFNNETFEWQSGYGAFSYGRSQLSHVCRYIENQEQHHAKATFQEEHTALLKAFEIEYKNEYLFEFYD